MRNKANELRLGNWLNRNKNEKLTTSKKPEPIPNDILKIVEKYGADKVITFVELIKK